ncbi:hypothetical protein ACQEVF_58635 [Nonomuraea polychroma]|uniref:hypothetical protein n=1 Tax=Nonomuraea polychroma TaxID=46176 RepID=UPI003D8F4929
MSSSPKDEPLNVVNVTRDVRKLRRLTVNARFMSQAKYSQLVDNIRRDGCLTSVPLIWAEPGHPEGGELILSGNHRCNAAQDAGVYMIDCKMINNPDLSKARRIAMQLAHNAIDGEDDPATLAQLYEEIDDVDWRGYAGLDDKELQLLEKVNLESLSEANLEFTTVQIVFLPAELEAARACLNDIPTSADETWLAARRDYETTLDALTSVHGAHNVGNVATAFGIMLQVFERHLTDLADGYDDGTDIPRHKGSVGLETVFGSRAIPAADAIVLRRALKFAEDHGEIEAGKGWQLIARLAEAYLAGEKAWRG